MININGVSQIDIASIHATILSIIIAIISAYAIYIYTNLDRMESQVFFEAERINRELHFAWEDFSPNKETYLASDINKREELINMWLKLFPLKNVDKNTEERGEAAVKIMNAISLFYPFPTRAKIVNDHTIERFKQPVSFKSIEMVQQWINDVWRDTTVILGVSKFNLRQILSDYSRKINKEMGIKDNTIYWIDYSEAFISSFIKAREIAGSTIPYLSQYKSYKKRLPSKWLIVPWLFFAGVAFLSGVFMPMFNISNSQICLIWIPLIFYVSTFSLILINIIRL